MKKLEYKLLNLKFGIITVFAIMIIGSVVIIGHGTNRFSNLIALNGSLIGILGTLVSSHITNSMIEKKTKKSTLYSIKQEIKNNLTIINGNMNYLEGNNLDEIHSNNIEIELKSSIWNNSICNISYIKYENLINELLTYYGHVSATQGKEDTVFPKSFFEMMKNSSEEILSSISNELLMLK